MLIIAGTSHFRHSNRADILVAAPRFSLCTLSLTPTLSISLSVVTQTQRSQTLKWFSSTLLYHRIGCDAHESQVYGTPGKRLTAVTGSYRLFDHHPCCRSVFILTPPGNTVFLASLDTSASVLNRFRTCCIASEFYCHGRKILDRKVVEDA
jgi:hypothetical protein